MPLKGKMQKWKIQMKIPLSLFLLDQIGLLPRRKRSDIRSRRVLTQISPMILSIRLLSAIILSIVVCGVHTLNLSIDRRDFAIRCSTIASCLGSSLPTCATDDIPLLLDSKTIHWDGPSWSSARYRASTLQNSANNQGPSPCEPTFYPLWMEGYHEIKYKFTGALFPQGRKVLSLRTPGAGLGTCLSLPNVGYNPAVHAIRFNKDVTRDAVYEDLAYNIPRKFEAFWPEAKILAVRTNGGTNALGNLGMKCFVTGDGCTLDINPDLHLPTSRVEIDFDAPTRRSGRMTQSTDVTMLNSSIEGSTTIFYTSRNFSQYNINQELQTFYKEISSWKKVDDGIVGKLRVASFLPKYIRVMDKNNAEDDYDETKAIAIYDYNVRLTSIDETEAAML